MALPQQFLDELRMANDITSVVSSYVNLKRSSRNMVGLCPFHSEKSPSFTVFSDTQSYYCFGCGAGGDVITFIKNIENLEYIEAVKFLAQRAGLRMPEDSINDAAARIKETTYKINKATAKFYYEQLISPVGKRGLDYFASRRLDPKTIKRFGLGYAPEGWTTLVDYLRSQGFSDRDMVTAGVAAMSQKNGRVYDYFRNRVMFPIIDLRGNVIAFGGRVLGDEKPKYLNSPDTPVFKKTKNLFALNLAKSSKDRRLVLAEGYMDVIALHQAGFDNTVASLGTALTSEQARMISNYADEVVVAYDSDGAGRKATQRAFAIFDELGIKVRVLSIPGAKDPDEFVKKYGAQRFKLLLDQSTSVTDYRLAEAAEKNDPSSPSGKASYLKDAAQVVADIASPVERDIYIRKLGEELSVSHEAIAEQVKSILKRRKRAEEKKDAGNLVMAVNAGLERTDPERMKFKKEAVCEDNILFILYRNPDRLEYITSKISAESFVTSTNARIFSALCQIIRECSIPDMTQLSQYLSSEDMSRVARLLASNRESGEMDKLLDDCINGLLSAKNSPNAQDIKTMDDDSFAEYMRQLKNKKK